jgi:Na+-driven multidrug efflux pump
MYPSGSNRDRPSTLSESLRPAVPLLVQAGVRVAQDIIDLVWLGRYSNEAISAVGLILPVVAILFALTIYAPCMGTQVLVSQ